MSFGATFLRRPDRFPAAAEGEPWGEREVALDLPGGPYRFSGLSPAQEAGVRQSFPSSVVEVGGAGGVGGATTASGAMAAGGEAGAPAAAASDAPIPVRLLRCAAGDFLPVDTRGWEYCLDTDWAPLTVSLAGLSLAGRLDWRPGLQGALWTPEDGGERFPGVFENFFRVLVAYRLLELGGVILHSAGVVKDGAAYLFLGRSGAGKTTVSRFSLARGAEVLSDDLNALCPDSAGCVVRKLPFTGDLGERRAARPPVPVGALLRLEQDTRDALVPLSRAQTLACLLACSPFVNVDPHRRERLEDVLFALLAAGGPPSFALHFSLAGGFWSIIEAK